MRSVRIQSCSWSTCWRRAEAVWRSKTGASVCQSSNCDGWAPTFADSLLLLTHFKLWRLVVWVGVLEHQHPVHDAERVLDAEYGAVAPGGRQHHQPAVSSFGRDESRSVRRLPLDPHLGLGSRGQGRLAPDLDQLFVAVLPRRRGFGSRRPVALVLVHAERSILLLHRGTRGGLLFRPGNSVGRLRLAVWQPVDPHTVCSALPEWLVRGAEHAWDIGHWHKRERFE